MKLPLAYYGDPILRKKGALITEINDEIRQLVNNMIDTMLALKGIGLAAPQVHASLALFIAYFIKEDEEKIDRNKIRVFINPKITFYSLDLSCYSEGCLSIPKLHGDVDRPMTIEIEALDLDGRIFTEKYHDFDAHIILHENDHINGVLFVDRLYPKERKKIESTLREIKKKFSPKVS
ncbi:MAG: peptide deformylase [Parachlamydiaceae bacterium]|nr:peptide deformylase [Parachlamydiaceae bacterium]